MAAPYNLAPNSQWEIWSAVGYGTQENPQGTGTEAPISSSGYTGGRTATFVVATTGDLSVGDLVTVQGNAGNWYGFYHDPFAETGGQVAPTVAHVWGQLEGIDAGSVQTGTGQVRGMMWYDRSAATPPGHSGSFLPQYVANVKSFASMDMPLNQADQTYDLRGTGLFQTGVSGDAWTNVALEYDMFLLN